MNKRIRMYARILVIIYSFMIGSYIASDFENLKISFLDGVRSANSRDYGYVASYFFAVSPKEIKNTCPTIEISDGNNIHYWATNIGAKIEVPKNDAHISLVSNSKYLLTCFDQKSCLLC